MARTSLLFFLLCPIFILTAQQATAQPGFLYHFCLNQRGNYTLNSTYQDNLNHLLSNLPSQNDNGYGFYNLSYGNASNQVHAIGLCRGDAKPEVCRSCLNDSTYLLKERCPNQMEAVGWYDNCMLRYSNRSLFRVKETLPQFFLWNTENVSSNIVDGYFQDLRSLLDGLKSRAAAGGSLRKFATGNVTAPGFKTIYGLVQCTPDLSQMQCNNCLDDAYGDIPKCCYGKKGGRVVGTSCNFRYEDYLFYESTDDTQPPSAPPQPPTTSPPPWPLTNATVPQSIYVTSNVIILNSID